MLGLLLELGFCARAFSSCGKRGPLFITVRGPLTIVASLVAEHRLQTRRLSSCGSRAQLLRGMWDPPRPGLEPVSPALAGRLSTTAPPGKPRALSYMGFLCRRLGAWGVAGRMIGLILQMKNMRFSERQTHKQLTIVSCGKCSDRWAQGRTESPLFLVWFQ